MSLAAKRWLILTYCTVLKEEIENQRKSRAVRHLGLEDLVLRLQRPSLCSPDPAWPLALPPLASASPLRWSSDGSLWPRGGWVSLGRWSRNLQVNHCLGVTQGPSQGCWGVSSGFDGIVLSKQTGLIFRSLRVAVKHVFSVLSPFPCRATAAACPWDPFPWKHVILYWSIFSLGQQNRGQNSGLTHSFVQDPLSEALSDPPLDVYKQHNL